MNTVAHLFLLFTSPDPVHPATNTSISSCSSWTDAKRDPHLLDHFLRTLQLLVSITPKQLFRYSYFISQSR